MGIFSVPVEVGDPEGSRFERVEALVDTGATFTIVPAHVLHRLGVEPRRSGSFELADGSLRDYSIGETRVRVDMERDKLTGSIRRRRDGAYSRRGHPGDLGACR